MPDQPAQNPLPQYPRAHIAVFARAPALGKVKTRLQPTLGAPGALALYAAMLDRTLQLVRQSSLAPMSLWVTSHPSHESFVSHCNRKEIYLQEGTDLGQRMGHCAEVLLARPDTDCLLIIGTDCPALTADYLQAALAALQAGQDCVLGPARDGGYVLIGLREPLPALFEQIEWGSSRVFAQTREVLAQRGLAVTVLEELWDVDEPADLALLTTLAVPLDWA